MFRLQHAECANNNDSIILLTFAECLEYLLLVCVFLPSYSRSARPWNTRVPWSKFLKPTWIQVSGRNCLLLFFKYSLPCHSTIEYLYHCLKGSTGKYPLHHWKVPLNNFRLSRHRYAQTRQLEPHFWAAQ